MRKYQFSREQRFALYMVYKHKCFWCGEPLSFQDVTVDHVIPEYLLEQPDELRRVTEEYGLGNDFSINDYCNWVPSHIRCNSEKGTTVFQRSPALIKVLQLVQRNAQRAKSEEQKITRSIEAGSLLGKLGIALEKGLIAKDDVVRTLEIVTESRESYEPIVVTFGLNIEKAFDNGLGEATNCTNYAQLSEWLERDLINTLGSLLTCSFYFPEPSGRTGETLSVRLALLSPVLAELENFSSPWWEILDINYYSEVYGEVEWAKKRYKDKLDKAPIISDSEFIELLHRGGVLVDFSRITAIDYRAVAISQDYLLYQSDSYYDLEMWQEILDLAGIEEWEVEEALQKTSAEST